MPQPKSKSKQAGKRKSARNKGVRFSNITFTYGDPAISAGEMTVKDIAELGGNILFSPRGPGTLHAEKDQRIKEMLSAREQQFLAEGRALDAPNDGFRGIRYLLKPSEKKVLPSGATRSSHLDERYDLMSPEANRRRALTYGHGAEAHGERNWEKGMPVSECINRAIRHLNLYLSGDLSEDHLAHAGVNIDFAMHFERHNPECLDGPLYRTPSTERTDS